MRLKLFSTTITLLILFSFVGTSIVPSGLTIRDLEIDSKLICYYEETSLRIINITYGQGLNIVLKNDGDAEATDIILNIKIQGGLIIKIPTTDFEIPLLTPGESIEKQIQIFGIGIGLLTEIPKITLSAYGSNAEITRRIINIKVFGPFVKKVNEIFNYEDAFDGYTLFAPMRSHSTYLINNSGEIIQIWDSNYPPGDAVYLLENGILLHTAFPGFNPTFMAGGIGGRVELLDINSNVLWEFRYSNDQYCLHHDVEMLPNGNILMIAWEYKTYAESIAAGRNPDLLFSGEMWPDHIIEVEPTGTSGGNIVWEWHVWDHLIQDYDPSKDNYGVVADHPELIDINFIGNLILNGDWNHINSIEYNEEFDQILLGVNMFSEIWIIDHSTTTVEAASHSGGRYGEGGDLLYRWGNPRAYRAGGFEDQKIFHTHDAQWIESGCPGEGNILFFNNGQGRPEGDYSSVEEIIPPVDSNGNYSYQPGLPYGPEDSIWEYFADNPSDLNAIIMSGTQRLPNGNTLICDGTMGIFYEVTYEKEIVWEYVVTYPNPYLNNVFKIRRYAPDYPGLENILNNSSPNKPTTPEGPINGKVGVEYFYTSSTTDSDRDDLFYIFDWGDESDSGWLGPYDSGEEVNTSHIWSKLGRYSIKVKAKDIYGRESEWSDLLIMRMPISTVFNRLLRNLN